MEVGFTLWQAQQIGDIQLNTWKNNWTNYNQPFLILWIKILNLRNTLYLPIQSFRFLKPLLS